jgi:ParB family protein of integrating conjugative element (PFGI_1 class)
MRLELAQIQCYERNPRRSRNPEYDRIKASILASGLDQPLRITRRPGATTYIVQAGGNTRLQILNELYARAGDERFNRVDCLYVEWQHESAVLLAHLRENDLRGDLTFIDKAQAVLDLRALLAGERGVPKISHRQLATLLKQRGYHASHVTVALMDYAVSVLLPAMPAALHAGLGRAELKRIRNLEQVGRGLWQWARLGELTEFRDMFRALCRRHDAVDWQFGLLRQALETELAEAAEAGLQSIRMAFEHGLSGQATFADPMELYPASDPGGALPEDVSTGVAEESQAGHRYSEPAPESRQARDCRDGDRSPVKTGMCSLQLVVEVPARAESGAPGEAGEDSSETRRHISQLRAQALVLAERLASRWGFADLIAEVDDGAGFVVCNEPLASHIERLDGVGRTVLTTLWWHLVAIAEMSFASSQATARLLYPESRLRAAISTNDWSGLREHLSTPEPVQLGLFFWRQLDGSDWQDWLSLTRCYRELHGLLDNRHSLWDGAPC